MKNQKIDTRLALVIIAVFIITAGVFVWMVEKNKPEIEQPQMQNQQVTVPQQNAPPIDNQQTQTTNTNTQTINYINKTYGFEFNYPANLVITQKVSDSYFGLSNQPDGLWVINITVSANTNNFSLVQAFNQITAKFRASEKIIATDINIDGKPAKKFSVQNYHDNGNAGVVIINGSNIITIHGTDSEPVLNTIFETVINSFKFTK